MTPADRATPATTESVTPPARHVPTPVDDAAVLRLLVSENYLTAERLKQYEDEAAKAKQPALRYIEDGRYLREEDIVRARAKLFGLPYIDVFGRIVRGDVLNLVSRELAENYRMVAFGRSGDEVSVAMVDPTNYKAVEAVEFIARKNHLVIRYFVVSESGFRYLLRQYESLSAEVEEALKSAEKEAVLTAGEKREVEGGFEEMVRHAPVSKMVSVILRHAVEGKASDVHIEPVGAESRVRYRVDGILHTSIILPLYIHASVVARIKVLANLKIDETRIPQDGRFHTSIDNHEIDYRVSVLPLFNNEKVVMRILDTSTGVSTLEALGFEGRNLTAVQEAIQKSHGMILMTGPTGSGKSTSLYAMLNILNQESVNIITLEDPIEYYIKGVNQSQINPDAGFAFASGLRAILRQDPDIIMVGEVRDGETASLATQGALTGHLILTTLHTNDSFGAIPRLIDMGIEPFLIAASLNVVIAQRLVRRVCPHCRAEVTLPKSVEDVVRKELAGLPAEVRPADAEANKRLVFSRGRGCPRCENTGYKGRLAIVEVFQIVPDVQATIVEGGDLLTNLRKAGGRQHIYTMKQDGILKALRGLTTIEEVLTATRE